MKRVYILGACRTAIGRMGGALSSISAVDLGAIVIKEAVRRSGLTANDINHVFMGVLYRQD